MKEHPILFSAPMVRAILDGRKTQTRRVVKVGHLCTVENAHGASREEMRDRRNMPVQRLPDGFDVTAFCPYGQPGDRLWVRETWGYRSRISPSGVPMDQVKIAYAADDSTRYIERPAGDWSGIPSQRDQREGESHDDYYGKYLSRWFKQWRPSIHMPRWASRITLEIVSVRVERLNDISNPDSVDEGVMDWMVGPTAPTDDFRALWESINGAGSWADNPWVWVVEFRRLP